MATFYGDINKRDVIKAVGMGSLSTEAFFLINNLSDFVTIVSLQNGWVEMNVAQLQKKIMKY